MRLSTALIIVVVRKQEDAPLVTEAGREAGWTRVLAYSEGQPGAPTPDSLRKVRRSLDPRKREVPVMVWCQTAEEEAQWRDAGAYVTRQPLTHAAAVEALRACAHGNFAWVESAGFVGPDRRKKKQWMLLHRALRRLSDASAIARQNKPAADASSFATHMRQLRHNAFGLEKADRDRRGQFLVDTRRAGEAATRDGNATARTALVSLARYITGLGAAAPVDEDLVEFHLDVADGSVDEAALARLPGQVDRALGLVAAV